MVSAMNSSKRSIKHYLILPSYQLRLVGFLSLIVMIGSFFHIGILNYISYKNLSEEFSQKQIELFWNTLRPTIIVTNAFYFIILCVFLIISAILITHKLIGPMLKVTGHLNKFNSGLIPKYYLKLREGDEGQNLCDAVNELQTKLREQYSQLEQLKSCIKEEETASKLGKILEEFQIEK